MALKEERSWSQLVKGWGATQIIWSLGNFSILLMEWLIAGDVSKTTWTVFISGEYGVGSACWIAILREKWGYMGKEDLKETKETLAELDSIAKEQLQEREGQKDIRKQVEELAKSKKNSAESTADTVEKALDEANK